MPKMQASDKFQGLCLESSQGSMFMSYYDVMPPATRELVRNSSFNLCAACVQHMAYKYKQANQPALLPQHYELAVKEMETMIRCEEV